MGGYQYTVYCQTAEDIVSAENLSLWINGEDTGNNALNLYEYYAHHDKAVIIGSFWAGALLVWLILLEVVDRAEYFMEGRRV